MKAVVHTQYGSPNLLKINEISKQIPKDNEVLVKVYAATVNRTDCAIVTGTPFIMRFITGLFKPRLLTTGTDFAGKIEAIGKNVTNFKVGNRVWGFDDSGVQSHADYMTFPINKAIITIPDNITYEQAAASAEGAHYAYNCINKVNLTPGQKVMVNGATGAIGSAAVQLLKAMGAQVTATCRGQHTDLVKSLGADKIINYETEDFTKDNEKYHYVFDTVGKSTFSKCKSLLHPGGVYISSELGPNNENPFLAMITPLLGGKKVVFPIPLNIKKSLQVVKNFIEQEKFNPLIDKCYPLEQITEAFQYVSSGQKVGNVVIKMA